MTNRLLSMFVCFSSFEGLVAYKVLSSRFVLFSLDVIVVKYIQYKVKYKN